MRVWGLAYRPPRIPVLPLTKLILLAWLVVGPVGLWLRRRRGGA